QRPAQAQQVVQVDALDELHHQKVRAAGPAGVVGGHDVGVGQFGRGADLAAEALRGAGPPDQLGPHDLQRHDAVHEQVDGAVDRAHRPAANAAEDEVARVAQQVV